MKSDIEIAQQTQLQPISAIARDIGIDDGELIPYGHHIAKISPDCAQRLADRPDGKLILVTAMSPTPQGNGKTTTTIGLTQALCRIGKRAIVAIREPSLGPCFGVKGGAAGGGYSQVLPMEEINLHFTGDIHAVTMAHNLLSSVIDNHLHQRKEPQINPRQVIWKRVIDMNDRSLRAIMVGMEEDGRNGVLREEGFEITAASEIMAILCLSQSIAELKERIGAIIVGYDLLRRPVRAAELGVQGAMTALLKQALLPNLVQTIEGGPALVHGGPFANIAHGCNSIAATRLALKLGDYAVTEAGFGADLGAEKFFDIKCRQAGLTPSAAVLVATVQACQLHGFDNLRRHVENTRLFNVPVVVSINRFGTDCEADLCRLRDQCHAAGIDAVIADVREQGGAGGIELAHRVLDLTAKTGPTFSPLYPLTMPILDKVHCIATRIYGAADVELSAQARSAIQRIEELGYGTLPVCIAKTPASFSDNPRLTGAPRGFTFRVSNALISAGAGFVVVYTGQIMTMPGLPRDPAALRIDIDDRGTISGLF